MRLTPGVVHIWSVILQITPVQREKLQTLLSPDEVKRAYRLHFPHHQQRFIAARGLLREILSLYLNQPPQSIVFDYSKHEKPQLPDDHTLQFNLSHSDDIAIYAITEKQTIGVDIEKAQSKYNPAIAVRYFTKEEQQLLKNAKAQERVRLFYQFWAKKEAVVKAIGKGLIMPLSSFSVSNVPIEYLTIDNHTWTVASLTIHPNYESAVATRQRIEQILFWEFIDRKPTCTKQLIIDS